MERVARDGPRPLHTAIQGKMAPVKVRGRYIRQIQGKMAPIKGRRYNGSERQDGACEGTPLREARGKRRPTGKPDTRGSCLFFQNTPGVGIPDGSAGNGGGL